MPRRYRPIIITMSTLEYAQALSAYSGSLPQRAKAYENDLNKELASQRESIGCLCVEDVAVSDAERSSLRSMLESGVK